MWALAPERKARQQIRKRACAMDNFASHLKAEISRLAIKEWRSQSLALKKSSAAQTAEVAELKRRIHTLEAAVSRLTHPPHRPKAPSPEAKAEQSLRFRADGFASLRKKLGLSAALMAQLLGVSIQSVYHWETGKSRPRAAQLQTIAAVRKLGKKEVAARLAR